MTKYYFWQPPDQLDSRIIIFLKGRPFGKSYIFRRKEIGGLVFDTPLIEGLKLNQLSYSGAVKRIGRRALTRARKAVIAHFDACPAL